MGLVERGDVLTSCTGRDVLTSCTGIGVLTSVTDSKGRSVGVSTDAEEGGVSDVSVIEAKRLRRDDPTLYRVGGRGRGG